MTPGVPVLKKKMRPEELYKERGSSGSGTQWPGDNTHTSGQIGDENPGTLETPSDDDEMKGIEESTQTTTDNSKTD